MIKNPHKHEEQDLQVAVAQLLDSIPMFRNKWCHIPNGGARDAKEGARLKKMGVKKGLPDILIFKKTYETMDKNCCFRINPCSGLAIELKSKTGKLTLEQEQWLISLKEEGWATEVCDNIDDVMRFLGVWYGIAF